jgi:type III pantothenate kinase
VLLAVDIGNTNTVLGVFDGSDLVESWRVKTDARDTADELALTYRGLLGGTKIDGVAACSTVPAVLGQLRIMLERYYPDLPAVVVEPGVRTGVPLLYDNPRELGSDRIVNALAAHHLYGGPSIVVDFGTSTNFDVVNAAGEFAGGVLAPGIEVSMDALFARAARLPKVPFAAPDRVISQTTTAALQSGLVYGFAGQVDAIVDRIRAELGALAAPVVATGGLADLIAPHSQTITAVDQELTLQGLRIVWERNRA